MFQPLVKHPYYNMWIGMLIVLWNIKGSDDDV
jgi:hypothetical protein